MSFNQRSPSHFRSGWHRGCAIVLLALAASCSDGPISLQAQGDSIRKEKKWYDTLEITKPRYARTTAWERLALSAFTAVSIPVGLTVGTLTLLPPSFSVLVEDGKAHVGLAISTGVGFGGDSSQIMFFPDSRLQVEAAYYFDRSPQPIVRGALLFDKPLGSVHRRDFFWLGMAGGGGIASDFRSVSPYLEGWIGVLNPMGIRFLTLFPMHNYGLRTRLGYSFGPKAAWYEIAFCATSTFW